MIFNRQNTKDIDRYYSGCYVKFKETGDRMFRILDVTHDYVRAQDSTGFDVWIDLNEDYNVQYVIPGRKIFQMKEYAAMLYRKPNRQFFRGMHQDNTGFAILNAAGEFKECPLDFAVVESFVNKGNYVPIHEILQNAHCTSWAVNDQIAIAREGVLKFGNAAIGKVSIKHKEIWVQKVFKLDMIDMFPEFTWKDSIEGVSNANV